jgi:hypothetical protein
MIQPSSFAIHVTYTCPLTCAHCCFSSGPKVRDSLPLELIGDAIRALDASTIKVVAFTGGEPFLLGNRLDTIVNEAHARGFVTRVVTSAYWARDPSFAQERLTRLHRAGLNELSISWDDFHEEQRTAKVTFEHVFNAFWAAKDLGLTAAVNIVQSANSRWTAERVRTELGLDPESSEVVLESPLNLTGRAETELADAGLRPQRYVGPCPYVITGPTLSAKGKLLACCGVIPHTDALVLDDDFRPENMAAAIKAGTESVLLNWLHLRGPYAILEWISERYQIPIPPKSDVGGNCEACQLLFHTKEYAERVHAAVIEKADDISGELSVLKALGFFETGAEKSIMRLWQDGSTIVDNAPLPMDDMAAARIGKRFSVDDN